MYGYMLGEVKIFAGNFAPRNWAFCNGQLLSISGNGQLYSILGNTFGGDKRTTFALPDTKNRTVIGMGAGPGQSDRKFGEQGGYYAMYVNKERLPSHNHTVSKKPDYLYVEIKPYAYDSNGSTASPVYAYPTRSPEGDEAYSSSANAIMGKTKINWTKSNTTFTPAGGTEEAPFNIVQPSLGTNYIICTSGLYPSRN